MKHCIYSILIFALTSPLFGQIPTDGLSHYYPFSGNANDVIFGNHALVVGNVQGAEDRFGIQNCAYSFDGEWTSVMLIQGGVGGFPVTADSSFSVSLWYRYGSDDPGDREYLYNRGWAYSDSVSFSLFLYDNNTPVIGIDMDQHFIDQNIVTWPNDTLWHHLVAVFEPSGFEVYFDNQLALESKEVIHNLFSADVHFGENFEGILDDVAFYNKALSVSEVGDLYNASSTCLVSLDELEIDITIYPNPASDFIQFNLKDLSADYLSMHAMDGTKVLEQGINASIFQIDVKDLSSGMYSLIIFHEGEAKGMKRIIIE
ncbi:MAG: LamG-like jellyroll fold domain-containing protein [Bacteroidota bacterium]